MSWGTPLLLTVLLTASEPAHAFETIELKSGHAVQGEVLKETPQELILDLGVDVLRIPREQVSRRYTPGSEPAIPASEPETPGDPDAIYATANLPPSSVKDLAERFGEAVVLVQTPSGLGSGFIVSDEGYCVTNFHVIERERRISVTIFQRVDTEFVRRRIDDVRIIALNPFLDLALLRIPAQERVKFTSVRLARTNELRAGDGVFAIGNPLGLERSVSQGIVSTPNRNFNGLTYVQTTAEINPGNSGGPLFNMRGEVVGVTNMKSLFGEGLGFAIPIAYVKHFLENREAFAFNRDNPNTGHRYLTPPRRRQPAPPPADLFTLGPEAKDR